MDGESSGIRLYRVQAEAWNTRTDYGASHHGLRASFGSLIHDPFVSLAPSGVCEARDDGEADGADLWPQPGEV